MNSPFTALNIPKYRDALDTIIKRDIPAPLTVEIEPTHVDFIQSIGYSDA